MQDRGRERVGQRAKESESEGESKSERVRESVSEGKSARERARQSERARERECESDKWGKSDELQKSLQSPLEKQRSSWEIPLECPRRPTH